MIFCLIFTSVSMVHSLPSCDASFITNLAQETLKQISILRIGGIVAIDLNNIKEVDTSSEERKCTASVKPSSDTEHTITYTLSNQKDNKIYLQVQLVN